MAVFKKIVKLIIGVLIFLFLLTQIIRFSSGNGYENAVNNLALFQKAEHESILKSCISLIENFSSVSITNEFEDSIVLRDKEIPLELTFANPEFIRYNSRICTVFLYKVPGKGIGYSITQQKLSEFKLQWFNDFQSWDRHDIVL